MLTTYLGYSDILQNAPFRSQISKIFFASKSWGRSWLCRIENRNCDPRTTILPSVWLCLARHTINIRSLAASASRSQLGHRARRRLLSTLIVPIINYRTATRPPPVNRTVSVQQQQQQRRRRGCRTKLLNGRLESTTSFWICLLRVAIHCVPAHGFTSVRRSTSPMARTRKAQKV